MSIQRTDAGPGRGRVSRRAVQRSDIQPLASTTWPVRESETWSPWLNRRHSIVSIYWRVGVGEGRGGQCRRKSAPLLESLARLTDWSVPPQGKKALLGRGLTAAPCLTLRPHPMPGQRLGVQGRADDGSGSRIARLDRGCDVPRSRAGSASCRIEPAE